MEHNAENNKQQLGIERFVLVLYSLYAINICYGGINKEWDSWILIIIGMGLVLSWTVHFARYKSYGVRAMFTAVFMSLTSFFNGFLATDFLAALPTFMVITCLIGLYGVPELVMVSGVNMMILVIRQVFLMATNFDNNQGDIFQMVFQIGNVALFILILSVWVKNRAKNAGKMQTIIEDQIAAERGKDDFVANVSHEIRTPLNSIYGISEMLQSEKDLEVVHKEAQNIQAASRNLISMVSDILDFSELISGETELEEEIYDITSTVNDVINMTMAQIGDKDLELIVDLDIHMPKLLMGDEKKIRRIIMSLVSNAVKFTSSGCIVIKIGGRPESYGLNLCISVKDTGIGMREEEVEKLFTNYNQADTRRNRQGTGIGLGIAISRLLAQKLGGVITVRSKEGKGSKFTLVVPQKIVQDTPVVEPEKNLPISGAYYFNLEQFHMSEIRDAYTEMISSMIEQFGINCQSCINLDELKRRVERKQYTHVFISYSEYHEDPEYFQKLANQLKLAVVLDVHSDNKEIIGNVLRIKKPFYALSVAAIFANSNAETIAVPTVHEARFIAPHAKILIVDDNLMNIRVAENLLAKYKIKTQRALSGVEALEKIGSMDYDFIFMDHMMPGMDGVEVTHRIRAKLGAYYQKVPIVALTANAIAGSREMFLSEGMNDFLEKPIEPSVLERVLRRNLPADKLLPIEEGTENQEFSNQEAEPAKQETPAEQELWETKTQAAGTPSREEDIWKFLDKESGLMYCGGEENYFVILAENVRFYEEMSAGLEKAYADRDYADYTIKIHALKSSMKSIGAADLSEKAKELEFAGKAQEYQKILDGHEAVMRQYHDLMEVVSRYDAVKDILGEDFLFGAESSAEESKQDPDGLKALSDEELSEMQKAFESAMYELDEQTMLRIVNEMKTCSLSGESLEKLAQKMEHKISMGDHFSAGDLLLNLKGSGEEETT